MKEKGMYYISDNFIDTVRLVGGQWDDQKQRPIVCMIKSNENKNLYWAIPMGILNHRNEEQKKRLNRFLNYPNDDLRSCYYHIGRTTNKSIFFISRVIPITDKYISEEHLDLNKEHFVIQNKCLISELQRKLFRILQMENSRPNYFQQHITDLKNYLLNEIEQDKKNTLYKMNDTTPESIPASVEQTKRQNCQI